MFIHNNLSRCVLLGVIVTAYATLDPRSSLAQCEVAKVVASDGEESDLFGWAAAIDGTMAVVGAVTDDAPLIRSGSAYVYTYDGPMWYQQQKLLAADADEDDYFGCAVSLSGDTMLIGAYNEGNSGVGVPNGTGAAYVFRFDGASWVQQAKLLALDGSPYEYFGWSVAVSGDIAVVGVLQDDWSYGSAYVFRRYDSGTPFDPMDDYWLEEAKLIPGDQPLGAHGRSVAVSGETVLIGADNDTVYVFRREGPTWVEHTQLQASDGEDGDWFGYSLASSGNSAIIGSREDNHEGIPSGSAYVFRLDDNGTPTDPTDDIWVQQAKLLAVDRCPWDRFGYSVSISDDTAVVGAISHRLVDDFGAAYVFRRDDNDTAEDPSDDFWVQEAKLLAPDGATDDNFGYSVAVSDENALVAAPNDDDKGTDSGSAYIFPLRGAGHGDLNCDCQVNNGDIDPFVLALTDATAYAAAYPACDHSLADCNCDGLVNNGDIDPFVALLSGG